MENYLSFIIFFHVLSAVIWVGGMIAIRFGVHYATSNICDTKIKLETTLDLLLRFFKMVIPSILILLVTAIILIIELELKSSSIYSIAIFKEIIWTIMAIIFTLIYIKRNKGQKYFESGDFKSCKTQLVPLSKYFIPANIILGLIAIYLGVSF
jgi:uncharacterized membrane protein